jgi:glutathione S-transferase
MIDALLFSLRPFRKQTNIHNRTVRQHQFAHRCTLALEHHRGRVEYEWVEALGWEERVDHDSVTGTGKQWVYHTKSAELLRASPGGLVPTLIPIVQVEVDDGDGGGATTTTTTTDETRSVYESIVTIEYVDDVSGATGKHRLVPRDDPFWSAKTRIWADRVNRECCSPYYGVLVRKDESERREHFENLLRGLEVNSRKQTNSGNKHPRHGGFSIHPMRVTFARTLLPMFPRFLSS